MEQSEIEAFLDHYRRLMERFSCRLHGSAGGVEAVFEDGTVIDLDAPAGPIIHPPQASPTTRT